MWKWVLGVLSAGWVVAEVWLLLEVGAWLGVGYTLLWMVGSSLAGLLLLRVEGLQVLLQIQERLRREELPTGELLDMGMILAGAVLLILPGFLSDGLGLLLLLPPVRWAMRGVIRLVLWRILPLAPPAPDDHSGEDAVIEMQRED
jgi:UPF0716 protein FxsA